MMTIVRGLAAVCVVAATAGLNAHSTEHPETVMLTLHARQGADEDLARALADHWSTARKLDLVKPDPHLTLRGAEGGGRVYFVEIFTWRDGEIPDDAPADIRAIWDRLNALTEARDGHPGLEISVMSVVAPH